MRALVLAATAVLAACSGPQLLSDLAPEAGYQLADNVVYVGGHQKWMNAIQSGADEQAGQVPRPGLAALDPQNGIPLTWNPGLGDQISFYYAPIMSGAPTLIGTDGFAGDGGSLTWTVPADANGYLSAEVISSDGRLVGQTAGITTILAE